MVPSHICNKDSYFGKHSGVHNSEARSLLFLASSTFHRRAAAPVFNYQIYGQNLGKKMNNTCYDIAERNKQQRIKHTWNESHLMIL